MKLLFINLSSLVFDAATPEREPLGGSESALCYLAQQLAKNDHNVTLAARLPDGTPDKVAGIIHRPIAVIRDKSFFDTEKFDAVITVNAAVACPRIKELSPDSINIFWDHLPPDQEAIRPLGNPALQQTLDHIVYVSAWQKAETEKAFGLNLSNRIIANGVTPSFENMFASPRDLLAAKQYRAAYTSVPDRGLSELLEAMPPDVGLDIYSSMRVYQTGDEVHADIFRRAQQRPNTICHGSVSQRELANRLKSAAFLTYPCTTPETFCLAALEGIAAGMKMIGTDVGGIKVTTMGFADLLPVDTTENRAQFIARYRKLLEKNFAAFKSAPDAWAERAFAQVQTVNSQCTWAIRAKEWESYLSGLMSEKAGLKRASLPFKG